MGAFYDVNYLFVKLILECKIQNYQTQKKIERATEYLLCANFLHSTSCFMIMNSFHTNINPLK